MLEKGLEYYMTLLGVATYVAARRADDAPVWKHLMRIVSSVAIALGMSSTVGEWLGIDEKIAMAGLVVFSHVLLDLGSAMLADRELIYSILRSRLNGDGNGKNS